jgi:hypothetical protein
MTEAAVKAEVADVTPNVVRGLWRYLGRLYKSNVFEKRRAPEMYLVAEALARLGIADREAFMREWSTTLGRRIYVPFTIGVGSSSDVLWDQIVSAVHEHQHIVQYEADGLGFMGSYLLSDAARAKYETEAYRSNLEMHWWRYGELLGAEAMADKLRSYAVSEADIAVAAKTLKVSADAVRHGAIVNESSNVAVRWLNANAPQLAAQGG